MIRRAAMCALFAAPLYCEGEEDKGGGGQDDDEKELIASVGEGTAAKPKPKEDDAEDDDEPEDEPEGDEPEVVETAAADDATDAPAPESSGVGGGSGGDKPLPEVAAPVAGSDEPTGVVPQPDPDAFNADPIIKRLDSAIEKIEKNELIEDYEKETKIAALLEQREGRVTKLADGASKAENQFRNNKARELGITRAQLDQAWNEALTETHKTLGKHSHDAAMLVLTQRAQVMKAKAPKNGHPAPTPKPAAPKAVAPTPITPQGARVAPPPAIVPPPPKKLTDEQELVESVRKAQKSGVRV